MNIDNIILKETKKFKGVEFDAFKGFVVSTDELYKLKQKVFSRLRRHVDVSVVTLDIVDYPVIVFDVIDDSGHVSRHASVSTYDVTSWDELLLIGIFFLEKKQFDGFTTLLNDNIICQHILMNSIVDFKETSLGLGLTVYDKNNKVVFPK